MDHAIVLKSFLSFVMIKDYFHCVILLPKKLKMKKLIVFTALLCSGFNSFAKNWSVNNMSSVSVNFNGFSLYGLNTDTCIAPVQPTRIIGAVNIKQCDSLQSYSVLLDSAVVSYFWSVTGTGNAVVAGNGSNAVVIKMKVAGTISVVASSGCAASTARTLAVIKAVPTIPGTIYSGTTGTKAVNTNICLFNASAFASTGVKDTMRIRSVANSTGYIWDIPGATISPVNDTTVAVVFADTTSTLTKIRVYTKSACDTSLAKVQALTKPVIAAPGAVYRTFVGAVGQAAVTNVCDLSVGSYSTTYAIRKVATATSYNWAVKGGNMYATIAHNYTGADLRNDTSITVTFLPGFTVDSITVQAVNGCSVSARKGVKPSVFALPPVPRILESISTVANNVCIGGPYEFWASRGYPTATQAETMYFRWTVPANAIQYFNPENPGIYDSSSANVIFGSGWTGGTISVRAVSACGMVSAAKSLLLTHRGCPAGTRFAQPTPTTQLYPNPNNGIFTLKVNTGSTLNEVAQIKVLDFSGRLVYQTSAKTINGNLSTNLQANLCNGVYMVVCIINGKAQKLRMVVQK